MARIVDKELRRRIKLEMLNFDSLVYTIPEVDNEELIPRIKIYEPDGSYWFRKIRFNRRINEE